MPVSDGKRGTLTGGSTLLMLPRGKKKHVPSLASWFNWEVFVFLSPSRSHSIDERDILNCQGFPGTL